MEPVRPFYRLGKVGLVKIFELQELRWPSMAVGRKNILALTHWRGFGGLGAVGCDASCRFAVEGGKEYGGGVSGRATL
jgi:hypothetical protein